MSQDDNDEVSRAYWLGFNDGARASSGKSWIVEFILLTFAALIFIAIMVIK